MRISCSTLGGLRTTASTESFLFDQIRTLVRVHDAGYEYVEMYCRNDPPWVRDTIKFALEEFGIQAYSIHLPKFLFMFEEEAFVNAVRSVTDFVRSLDIRVAVLHPPNEEDIGVGSWRKRFETLLEALGSNNCTLTYEIVPYVTNIHKFIEKEIGLYDTSKLGVTIDLEFMHIQGLDIKSLMEMFGEKVCNVHFRDSDGSLLNGTGKRKYLVPGTGEIDLCGVIRVLQESEYKGALTVEVSHRKKENIIKSREFIEYCINILD